MSCLADTIKCSLLLLCACKYSGSTAVVPTAPEQGDGVSAIQFQDIVVPDGLKLRDSYHESYSIEETGWRLGHFVYSGLPHLEESSAHVISRMPQHSWSLLADEKTDESTRKLRFARGRYFADYSFRRQDGITQLVIDY